MPWWLNKRITLSSFYAFCFAIILNMPRISRFGSPFFFGIGAFLIYLHVAVILDFVINKDGLDETTWEAEKNWDKLEKNVVDSVEDLGNICNIACNKSFSLTEENLFSSKTFTSFSGNHKLICNYLSAKIFQILQIAHL